MVELVKVLGAPSGIFGLSVLWAWGIPLALLVCCGAAEETPVRDREDRQPGRCPFTDSGVCAARIAVACICASAPPQLLASLRDEEPPQ